MLYAAGMSADLEHNLRIGELGRRVGVSPELLRAWERRYGLLEPARTGGGLRLYSARDEQRVRLMQDHLEGGHSAAEAARLALAGTSDRPVAEQEAAADPGALAGLQAALRDALDPLDAEGGQAVLDRAFASFTLETVLSDLVLPYLADLGERWARGEASVAQEHFASNLIRGRLLALARGWERGSGRIAVLACAPGEQHDLPLVMFGLALRNQGWRILYLGSDTPLESVAESADRLHPALVVVGAVMPGSLTREVAALRRVAAEHRVALAGAGADAALAERVGAEWLAGDPIAAAASL